MNLLRPKINDSLQGGHWKMTPACLFSDQSNNGQCWHIFHVWFMNGSKLLIFCDKKLLDVSFEADAVKAADWRGRDIQPSSQHPDAQKLFPHQDRRTLRRLVWRRGGLIRGFTKLATRPSHGSTDEHASQPQAPSSPYQYFVKEQQQERLQHPLLERRRDKQSSFWRRRRCKFIVTGTEIPN